MADLRRLVEKTEELDSIITTRSGDVIDLDGAEMISVQCIVDVNTPAAKVFTAAVSDILTAAAHGFITGLKGQASTTTTLPDGLALTTDYFVIVLSANTFSLASSLVNALAGTAIDILDAGTGDHTFTPTALAGATVKLEKSNSSVKAIREGTGSWSDVAAATSITADGTVWLEKDRPTFRWARLSYTLTAGSMSTDNHVLVKGSQA